jgi:hypothetical protein
MKARILFLAMAIALTGGLQAQKKSVGGAVLRSLVVPGWGEYYAGNTALAKWTFGSELAVWSGYFYLNARSRWLERDYKDLAETHAGITSTDRGKQFWIDVGASEDIFAHNERMARSRDQDAIYTDTEAYYWRWPSVDLRADYNHVRVKSGTVKEYAESLLGAALLTRLVSGILAAREVRRHNRDITSEASNFQLQFTPVQSPSAGWYTAAKLSFEF